MPVKSYRDLVVWQKAIGLVEETYRITTNFPKSEEFGVKAQMRSAAVSISSNIAEGQARNHSKEFVQFLHSALGSLSELGTQIDVAERLTIHPSLQVQATRQQCFEVGKMLHGLANPLHPHGQLVAGY